MKRFADKLLRAAVMCLVFLMANAADLYAQCAMCRASVESNVNEDGVGFAAKLNIGILYLFIMPYLLAIFIGYFWYKKSKEHRKQLEEAALRRQKIANL